jgi:hypothetical protein
MENLFNNFSWRKKWDSTSTSGLFVWARQLTGWRLIQSENSSVQWDSAKQPHQQSVEVKILN